VAYKGPDWASLGPLHWPAPKRYTSPGDLLDFVYEGSPVLLTQLTIDPEAWSEAGKPEILRFDLDFEWFVCKDICLLGEQTVTVEIQVDQHLDPNHRGTPNRSTLFREARARLPVAHADIPAGTFKAEFENGRLRIKAPGAARLTFFPAASKELALPVDSLREGQKEGETLEIRYRDEAANVDYLEGVLVIERAHSETGQVTRESFEVKVPVEPNHGASP
jgi:DsbC/DsbD-like thiol-disulfide interchange protein